jgi:hypothetical protein
VGVSLSLLAFFSQSHALMHAKAVLLVDDEEGELFERNSLLK